MKKKTGETSNNASKDVEIMVPWKYLTNFLRTREFPLIHCEINFVLSWSLNCFPVASIVSN